MDRAIKQEKMIDQEWESRNINMKSPRLQDGNKIMEMKNIENSWGKLDDSLSSFLFLIILLINFCFNQRDNLVFVRKYVFEVSYNRWAIPSKKGSEENFIL